MGIRYLTPDRNPQRDHIRPRTIIIRAKYHLNCPKPTPKEFIDVYQSGKEEWNWCCVNCCLFCVFDATKTEIWRADIKDIIKFFKNKKLFVLYIVRTYECDFVDKLIQEKLDRNGVILTEDKYKKLMHLDIGGGTIEEKTTRIENGFISLRSGSERLDISIYKNMRENLSAIIINQIRALDT